MVEIYLAYILVCGYEGHCKMFQDITGVSYSISDCQKKIDDMWIRIRKYPKSVESTEVGKFSFVEYPRGFCVFSFIPKKAQSIEKKYSL